MSTYKFDLTKRHLVSSQDLSQWAPAAETYVDATDQSESQKDIDITVYLDDVEKNSVTVTDAGATLQFDADISQGAHTIKIAAPKDPIQRTNVCVDTFLIGSSTCVASQYNFNQSVLGTTSTLRQMLAMNNSQPHNHVWWGHTVTNDASLNLPGVFYRPTIVSNHQGEWHMDFTKTADGKIWINNPGDVDDIMFDSTLQHTYYFVTADDIDAVNTAYQNYQDQPVNDANLGDSTLDTTQQWVDAYNWQGPGTYIIDSTSLVQQNDGIDISVEDANSVVVFSLSEYNELIKGLWYHRNYTVTPITVS